MRPDFDAVPPAVRRRRWTSRAGLVLAGAALALAGTTAAPAFADDPNVTAGDAATASAEVTVRKGDRGPAVRRIQRRLGIGADGVFGPQTRRAVKRFQRSKDLDADGIVGPLTRRALRLRPFSSGSVRHPRKPRQAPVDDSPSGVRLPAVLRSIAECESGGNPRAVSPGGQYRGKFQFLRSTWKAWGGRTADPIDASEAHQDRVALRLYRAEGIAPWPACGARATG